MEEGRLDSEYVININDLILKYVMKSPLYTERRKKIDFRLSAENIEDNLQIRQSSTEFQNVELVTGKAYENCKPASGLSPESASLSSSLDAPATKKRQFGDQVVFASTFVNNTSFEQKHQLNTERSTTATSHVSVDKTVVKGADFQLSLTPPNLGVEAGIGLKKEISLGTTRERTVEETITWNLNTEVCVPPRTSTLVELVIQEQHIKSSFTIETVIEGSFQVRVYDREGNSIGTLKCNNLLDVFPETLGFKRVDNQAVKFVSHGQSSHKFGVHQRVEMTETALGV